MKCHLIRSSIINLNTYLLIRRSSSKFKTTCGGNIYRDNIASINSNTVSTSINIYKILNVNINMLIRNLCGILNVNNEVYILIANLEVGVVFKFTTYSLISSRNSINRTTLNKVILRNINLCRTNYGSRSATTNLTIKLICCKISSIRSRFPND